jgi:hypothetical protein
MCVFWQVLGKAEMSKAAKALLMLFPVTAEGSFRVKHKSCMDWLWRAPPVGAAGFAPAFRLDGGDVAWAQQALADRCFEDTRGILNVKERRDACCMLSIESMSNETRADCYVLQWGIEHLCKVKPTILQPLSSILKINH